jgi:hypothetical protein
VAEIQDVAQAARFFHCGLRGLAYGSRGTEQNVRVHITLQSHFAAGRSVERRARFG